MNHHRTTTTLATATATLAVLAIVTAGCTAVDRAGGKAGQAVTTLTFAQANDTTPPAQVQAWADQVEEDSDGSLEIAFQNGYRAGDADVEAHVIDDVEAGKVDLGWVGARALDRAGVDAFQALLVPMLVDSQDLQESVFDAGIPEEMLPAVDEAGVHGVAVLPGPMRKLLGIDHPFLEPGDFEGQVIGMQDSVQTEEVFATLGATTQPLPSGADISGVDGYEQQLMSIYGNGYDQSAGFVTANLNFWPRPIVVIANQDAYDALTEAQRPALDQAGEEVTSAALDASRAEDQEGTAGLCRTDMEFPVASPGQLDALAHELLPVYQRVREDATSSQWLRQILQLKDELGLTPDSVSCSTPDDQTGAAPLPDGKYQATLTAADVAAGCRPGEPGADNLLGRAQVDRTLELDVHGSTIVQTEYPMGKPELREPGWHGTYRTFRDTFELVEDGGVPLSSSFDFDGRRLLLTDMKTDFCDARVVWTEHPWVLVGGEADVDPVAGNYRATIDWPHTDVKDECKPSAPEGDRASVYLLHLEDGAVSQDVLVGGTGTPVNGYRGTYRVFRDKIQISDGIPLTASFTVDDESLVLTSMTGGQCGDAAVWTSSPWERVTADSEDSLTGTWTTQLTAADWDAAGIDGPTGQFTVTFDDGVVTVIDPDGSMGYRASYDTFRGRLVTSGGPDELRASYRVDDDRLELSDVSVAGLGEPNPYVVVWESQPYERQR